MLEGCFQQIACNFSVVFGVLEHDVQNGFGSLFGHLLVSEVRARIVECLQGASLTYEGHSRFLLSLCLCLLHDVSQADELIFGGELILCAHLLSAHEHAAHKHPPC